MKASEAYGEYDKDKKQVLKKKDLASFTAAWLKLEKGEKLTTQMWKFEIIATDKESITIDTNHALAGKDLTFEVKIEEIK
jgi:FKBP-type peptidyl-prolyl cis-trans isomerase 2